MPVRITVMVVLNSPCAPSLRVTGSDHVAPPSSDHEISITGSVCMGTVPGATPTPVDRLKYVSEGRLRAGKLTTGPLSSRYRSGFPSSEKFNGSTDSILAPADCPTSHFPNA